MPNDKDVAVMLERLANPTRSIFKLTFTYPLIRAEYGLVYIVYTGYICHFVPLL